MKKIDRLVTWFVIGLVLVCVVFATLSIPPQVKLKPNTEVLLQTGGCYLPDCIYWEDYYGNFKCTTSEPGHIWKVGPCLYFEPGCDKDSRWFRKMWAGRSCSVQNRAIPKTNTGF